MHADPILLATLFALAALLYASVGHGGGSAYLASMALLGTAPASMRPTALVLNILVAGIGTYRFARAGHFCLRTFWPFAAGSVPLAYFGGGITLPNPDYRRLVGVVLLVAALRLAWAAVRTWRGAADPEVRSAPLVPAVAIGAGIGFLAGITSTGGGIFLSPLLLFARWADAKRAAAVSAAFILVNSIAGLAANPASLAELPPSMPLWASAACVGGLVGAELGARRFPPRILRMLLAAALVVAGGKLLLT